MKRFVAMRGWARDLGRTGLAAAATAVLLAACGGGTERVDPFVPVKLVAFGDEASLIESDGRKYTINGMNTATPPVRDCAFNPIWVQYLAASFGMVFQQCPGTRTDFAAVTKATAGAKVADVAAAVQTYIAANSIGSKDLFTVYAGLNDVIAIYEDVGITDKRAAAEAAGIALAQQVNALAIAGGRVIYVAIPDAGLTPYANTKLATDANAVATLSMLSERFNTKLYVTVINDGRAIGLVSAEEMVQVIKRVPAAFGYDNVTEAACKPTIALLDCTAVAADLVDGAVASLGARYLWASDRQLSAAGHARLGALAESRAKNNPF